MMLYFAFNHLMPCADLNIGICPGNQQWRLTYILTTPNPPIATCEPTCDNPQQDRDEFCLRTATPAWKCACPENKPILSDDGVTCIEEKFCPLKCKRYAFIYSFIYLFVVKAKCGYDVHS